MGITVNEEEACVKVEVNSLLVDSCCETHVIGKTAVKGEGIQPSDRKLHIKTARGHRLGHYGWKHVHFESRMARALRAALRQPT